MKKIKALLTAICFAFGVLFNVHAQSWLTNGLVAYYPFNGNADDESGNGNDATINTATLSTGRLGSPNTAYSFDGIATLISVPDSPSLRITNDITMTCWLRFSAPNLRIKLVGKGGDCGRNYGLWADTESTFWLFQQFSPEGGCIGCQENTFSASPVAQLDRWYQMVGIRSGSVSRLYLNGVLLQERSPTCSGDTYTGNEPLLIGAFDNPITDPRFNVMRGSLDDIRIYNRALSSNEVAQLYAIESRPRVDLIRAVKPSFSNMTIGTNYQLQISGNLINWTNQGSAFTAATNSMIYPQYWDVDGWGSLFFRLQVAP